MEIWRGPLMERFRFMRVPSFLSLSDGAIRLAAN